MMKNSKKVYQLAALATLWLPLTVYGMEDVKVFNKPVGGDWATWLGNASANIPGLLDASGALKAEVVDGLKLTPAYVECDKDVQALITKRKGISKKDRVATLDNDKKAEFDGVVKEIADQKAKLESKEDSLQKAMLEYASLASKRHTQKVKADKMPDTGADAAATEAAKKAKDAAVAKANKAWNQSVAIGHFQEDLCGKYDALQKAKAALVAAEALGDTDDTKAGKIAAAQAAVQKAQNEENLSQAQMNVGTVSLARAILEKRIKEDEAVAKPAAAADQTAYNEAQARLSKNRAELKALPKEVNIVYDFARLKGVEKAKLLNNSWVNGGIALVPALVVSGAVEFFGGAKVKAWGDAKYQSWADGIQKGLAANTASTMDRLLNWTEEKVGFGNFVRWSINGAAFLGTWAISYMTVAPWLAQWMWKAKFEADLRIKAPHVEHFL